MSMVKLAAVILVLVLVIGSSPVLAQSGTHGNAATGASTAAMSAVNAVPLTDIDKTYVAEVQKLVARRASEYDAAVKGALETPTDSVHSEQARAALADMKAAWAMLREAEAQSAKAFNFLCAKHRLDPEAYLYDDASKSLVPKKLDLKRPDGQQ